MKAFTQISSACIALALLNVTLLTSSLSQAFNPDKPIKILVGFAPGGSSDIVARLLAQKMSSSFGQPLLVENRAGAGGAIATEAVAKSAPDGTTWVIVPSGHATQAVMRKSLPFHPVRDFTWVSSITTYPMLIGVRPDSPYKTLSDVINATKKGVKVTYSSAGVGTGHHLLGELINSEAQIEMTHIPFKGGTPALTEVLGGRVDLFIETMTFALPQVQNGLIRALAVSSAQPSSLLPQVPAAASTLLGVQFDSWLGIAIAPNTSSAIVDRINSELRKTLAQPEVQKKLAELGGQAAPSSPKQFQDRIESEIAKFNAIVDSRKIERE